MFNIISFYKDNNIPYKTEGKNVNQGWYNISCIFCQDSSEHLGFNPEGDYFNCWKCGFHSLYSVIKTLLPFSNPYEIIEQYSTNYVLTDKIQKKINYNNTTIKIPGNELSLCHKLYLKSRNFDPEYLESKYKLKGTLHHNLYPYRIIIPIYFNNKLCTFQTRNIKGKSYYINCDPSKEIIPIKETIYNLKNCNEDYIIIVEGVMKVFRLGDNSCCLFGKNFKNKQLLPLLKYKKIFIFYDPDAQKEAKKLADLFDSLGKEAFNINHSKAPDNLNEKEVKEFWKNIKIFL